MIYNHKCECREHPIHSSGCRSAAESLVVRSKGKSRGKMILWLCNRCTIPGDERLKLGDE